MSIGTFFSEGLPNLVEQIGGLAGGVVDTAAQVKEARDAVNGDSRPETVPPVDAVNGDSRPETVPPVDTVKDTQGPLSVVSQYIPSNTIMVIGGVALTALVVMIILKKKG